MRTKLCMFVQTTLDKVFRQISAHRAGPGVLLGEAQGGSLMAPAAADQPARHQLRDVDAVGVIAAGTPAERAYSSIGRLEFRDHIRSRVRNRSGSGSGSGSRSIRFICILGEHQGLKKVQCKFVDNSNMS